MSQHPRFLCLRPTLILYSFRVSPKLAERAEANLDGRDAATWRVYADGVLLGFVELPANVDVKEIGADYLLGVETSALGQESVVRVTYELSR